MPENDGGDGRKPIPDPTSLTTEQLHREAGFLRQEFAAQREFLESQIKSLDRLVEEKFVCLDQLTEQRFAASEKAIDKAEEAIEKRADATYVSLTELSRNLSNLMPRAEAETRYISLAEAIGELKDRVSKAESIKIGGQEAIQETRTVRAGTQASITTILSVIGGIIAAMGLAIVIILSRGT